MNALTALSTTAATALIVGTASAVPVTFTDFNAQTGTFVEGQTTASATVDGVTLTMGAVSGTFNSTGGGTGIITTPDVSANDASNINNGESYTLRFDTAGTLTSLTALLFGENNITVTAEDGDAVTFVKTSSSTASGSTIPLGLSFDANELLTVTNVSPARNAAGNNFGYRINAVNVDAVPEPGSLALALAGGTLLLARRRKG